MLTLAIAKTQAGPQPINIASHMSVLILHSLVEGEEQLKVFEPIPPGHTRVVLATNIAESSVTIPDVRYVIGARVPPGCSLRVEPCGSDRSGQPQGDRVQRAVQVPVPAQEVHLAGVGQTARRPNGSLVPWHSHAHLL